MRDATSGDGRAAAPRVDELGDLAGLVGASAVDGVPVLLAGGGGPVSGGILFRVGWADERLARRGITHLVEHLALFGVNPSDVHHNGATDEYSTHFHAAGSVAEVVAFLNGVCSALRSLPLDRMAVEKGVLETEASRRGAHPSERLRLERYGARGPGLGIHEGFGLTAVSEDAVTGWVGAWFTRGNAVAWITTEELPHGLDLRLPEGPRRPIARAAEVVPSTPSFYRGPDGVLVIDALVPATPASVAFSSIATRVLFQRLRQDRGLSYEARCDWERAEAADARLTLLADALPDRQAAMVGEVVDVLADLRGGRFDEAHVAAARSSVEETRAAPFLGAQMLPATAFKLAAGIEIRSPDSLAADLAQVTAADVAEVARLFMSRAVAQIPEGSLDWAGFRPLPAWSETAVTGSTHARAGSDRAALVIGREGVTLRVDAGVVTVRFAETEALELWPDGARRLTGSDGFQVTVEPTLHPDLSPEVIAGIDEAVPGEMHIPRPARPEAVIPRP
jgi:hypothetical protein